MCATARQVRAGCYIPSVVKLPLTYRFKLSDREFASAWLREYYRRPGLRVLRILAGPALAIAGIMLSRSTEAFTHVMAIVTLAFGVWLAIKPLVTAWALTSRRRRARRADAELEVRFDRAGMRVADGPKAVDVPWEKIERAGLASDYVWIALTSGGRATIPRRAIADLDELRDLLSSRVEWTR